MAVGKRFREVFERFAIGIVLKNTENRIAESSSAIGAMLGYEVGSSGQGSHVTDGLRTTRQRNRRLLVPP